VCFNDAFKERTEILEEIIPGDEELRIAYLQSYLLCLSNESKTQYSDDYIIKIRKQLLQFEFEDLLKAVVDQEMHNEGVSFRSYVLPLSAFFFTYFAGFLITLPLINSIFEKLPETILIPLFVAHGEVEVIVVQWGFLGGFVYTSISLLTRFLRRDLMPRVYLLSSFKLLLSSVVGVIIYLIYMLRCQHCNSK